MHQQVPNKLPAARSSVPSHLDKASPLLGEVVELEQIERLFGDGRTLQDGGAALLHEGEQAAHPLPPAGRVVHLEQTGQALRLLRGGGREGSGLGREVWC